MKDPILLKKIEKEVQAGNVSASEWGGVTLYKYTQDCQYDGRWNEVNRECRGIIMGPDGTIYARPFSKFFNLGEMPETSHTSLPWHMSVEVFEKLDGSCGTLYTHPYYGMSIATPGSMESDQAKYATKIFRRKENSHYLAFYNSLSGDATPIFEIIYPANRIVCDYGEREELVLLGIRHLNGEEWHQRRVDNIAAQYGIARPRRFDIDLRGSVSFPDNEEGYVALFSNGLRIKVKSPAYLRVHRLLNYLSPKGVIELIQGREYRTTLEQLPPSIQQSFDDIRVAVQTKYDQLRIALENIYNIIPKEVSRKEQALWIQANANKETWGLLFNMLDNKDITTGLWKNTMEAFQQ
jgi:RNA ligase